MQPGIPDRGLGSQHQTAQGKKIQNGIYGIYHGHSTVDTICRDRLQGKTRELLMGKTCRMLHNLHYQRCDRTEQLEGQRELHAGQTVVEKAVFCTDSRAAFPAYRIADPILLPYMDRARVCSVIALDPAAIDYSENL